MVEMKASGEAAVIASEVRSALSSAQRVIEHQGARFVAGKSFTFQQPVQGADGQRYELWVDNQYRQEIPLQTVIFGSDAYFKLAEREKAAAWLSVSPEMVVVIDDVAYRITMDSTPEHQLTPVPLPSPKSENTPPPAPPNPLQSLWEWLSQLFSAN